MSGNSKEWDPTLYAFSYCAVLSRVATKTDDKTVSMIVF